MTTLAKTLLKLTKRLYPTGRAFNLRNNGIFERIHKALAISEEQAYRAATRGILDTILPDNDNFTAEDASDWERRLGIFSREGTTLEDRKAAIVRKYAHPGNILPRQSRSYLEGQLQRAGFNVFVHENLGNNPPVPSSNAISFANDAAKFGPGNTFGFSAFPGQSFGATGATFSPGKSFGVSFLASQPLTLGDDRAFLGPITILKGGDLHRVANFIDVQQDFAVLLGANFSNTFSVGGPQVGTIAVVPAVRQNEFRQLILQLKPAQMIALLYIRYL